MLIQFLIKVFSLHIMQNFKNFRCNILKSELNIRFKNENFDNQLNKQNLKLFIYFYYTPR